MGLDPRHEAWLATRGIRSEHLAQGAWRTLPSTQRERLAAAVVTAVGEENAAGVPGIWRSGESDWVFQAPPGIVIPAVNPDGLYYGIRCIPEGGGPAVWATSPAHGTEPFGRSWSHSPAWIEGGSSARIAPDILDAEAATATTGIPTVAVPGPWAWEQAAEALSSYTVVDVQWVSVGDVPNIDDALKGLAQKGFNVVIECWPDGRGDLSELLMSDGTKPVSVAAEEWLVARSGGRAPRLLPGPPKPSPSPVKPAPLPHNRIFAATDYGNAERLVAAFGRDFRYDWEQARWLVWDGRRWQPDRTGEMERRAKSVSRAIAVEATWSADALLRRELEKWAVTSEGKGRLTAMLATARSEPGIAVASTDLDADPWLLNVANGTIDLRDGTIRPHDRGELLTKIAPVNYDEDATFAPWEAFLEDITSGDEDFAKFLQTLVGYSLAGVTNEEVLALVYGPGGSGKSTFIESIKATLGDYARTADFSSFISKRDGAGPRDDIAELAGARFVSSSEVEEGKRLAAALVKQLTGSDTVRARRLYREGFEFKPQFQLWLVCNHAPRVDAWDSGFWRRVLRVPFENPVPDEKRNPALKATLSDPKIAGPAILAWAVKGCIMWRKEGLKAPDIVLKSTAQYRAESDPVTEFLDSSCEFGGSWWTASAALREAYEAWCEQQGEDPASANILAQGLNAKGCAAKSAKRQGKVTRGWAGVRLLSDTD